MNKYLCLLITIISVTTFAQNKTIVVTESRLPYTSQTWFYSGSGNNIQEQEIEKYWNEDKRITSASYTSKGWFITMAKETGIGQQAYKISSSIPKEWIEKKWNENYYISNMQYGNGRWFVVMSKGLDITEQAYQTFTNMESMKKWCSQKWEENYFITDLSFFNNGNSLLMVMSNTGKYTEQGFLSASSYDKLKDEIDKKIWSEDYNIQQIKYIQGCYIVLYCKYSNDNGRGQSYTIDNSDISKFISEKWDEDNNISYIGGGCQVSSPIQYNVPMYNMPSWTPPYPQQWNSNIFSMPNVPVYTPTTTSPSTINSSRSNPNNHSFCSQCANTKKCPQCGGDGMRTDTMFGTGKSSTAKCGICGGSGRCPYCK